MKKIIFAIVAIASLFTAQNLIATNNTELYTYQQCSSAKPVKYKGYIYSVGTGEFNFTGDVYLRVENGKYVAHYGTQDYEVYNSDRCEYKYMIYHYNSKVYFYRK